MPDSIRQTIFDAVMDRMRLIKVAGGYETDIGHHVFEFRDMDGEPWGDKEAEGLNVRDIEEPAEDQNIRPHAHLKELFIELEFRALEDTTAHAAKRARKIIADIEKALGVDKFWGGKAQGTSPLSVNNLDVKKADRIYALCQLKFSITYRQLAFNPYAQ